MNEWSLSKRIVSSTTDDKYNSIKDGNMKLGSGTQVYKL